MSIYTVTLCLQDQNAGGNPLWHTCILLSRLDTKTHKMEVVESWGFYGMPTTSKNSCFRKIKINLGLDVDLYGNHGKLKKEEWRWLDLGQGLHGVTFQLTAEKFTALQTKCLKQYENELEAINEIAKESNLPAKTPEKTRIYPYEDFSCHIFEIEKARAVEEKRPSRLQPFELNPFTGLKTCKLGALHLLDGILTPEQIARIKGGHPAISRFSGKTELMYLHSSGPTRTHKKKSGEVVHFRNSDDKGVQLHWTLPPQEIETISDEVRKLFHVDEYHCDEVKKIIRQLQLLEWLFQNAQLDPKVEKYRDDLLQLIKSHYEVFGKIKPKFPAAQKNWSNSILWLFSAPRDQNEKLLLTHINNAKHFINSLYFAIADNWELEFNKDSKSEDNDEIDLEVLAAYLPEAKKKELCKIIGRSYLEPEKQSNLGMN